MFRAGENNLPLCPCHEGGRATHPAGPPPLAAPTAADEAPCGSALKKMKKSVAPAGKRPLPRSYKNLGVRCVLLSRSLDWSPNAPCLAPAHQPCSQPGHPAPGVCPMDVGAAQWARVLPLSLGIVLMLCCKSDEQINASRTKGGLEQALHVAAGAWGRREPAGPCSVSCLPFSQWLISGFLAAKTTKSLPQKPVWTVRIRVALVNSVRAVWLVCAS